MENFSVGFECYSIGDLLLDAGTQEVTRDGSPIAVPRLSFKLLLSLARNAPNVVSSEQLEQEVWSRLVVDRGTINKRVLLLRKSLGEDRGEGPYITVVRGSGYRLTVAVERLEACPDELAKPEVASRSIFGSISQVARSVIYGLIGLIMVFGLIRGYQGYSGDAGLAEDKLTESDDTAVVFSQRSIAVLPFVDLNDDQAHHYIGDGLAEEVISLLSGMPGLGVAARTSSFSFRDSSSTIAEIAAKLKVGTILEGSFRHSDGQLRITAQLIDTRTGQHIWSQNYDRSFQQVFEVQDDIAFNIAQSLKLTLDAGTQLNSRQGMTGEIEAFKFYLKGRDLLNERIHLRSAGLHQALQAFSEAIEIDPKFARAHAGIATVYWLLTSYDTSLDRDRYYELAETSANFALALNPDSTEALSALAAISSERGEVEKAAKNFDRIREIGTESSSNISWEALLHIRLGYFEELIAPLSEHYALEPLNEHIAWALADALMYSGKSEQAVDILLQLRHFSFRNYYLGLCAIYVQDFATAREYLRDAEIRSGVLPAVYADLLIDGLEDSSRFDDTVRTFLAAAENGSLDKLISFESLLVLGSPEAFTLGINPFTDINRAQVNALVWNNWAVTLRRDKRFKDWVTTLGYVDFWHKFGWPDRCRQTGLNDFECI